MARTVMQVFDEIARIKKADVVFCHVGNQRISDRFLRRQGWEPHLPKERGRHFIKRYTPSPYAGNA